MSVGDETTALYELGDAYLISRGSSHVSTLRSLKFSLKRDLRRGELRIGVVRGSVSVGGGCCGEPVLDLSNANLPTYVLERAPECVLAASRLLDISKSSWRTGNEES